MGEKKSEVHIVTGLNQRFFDQEAFPTSQLLEVSKGQKGERPTWQDLVVRWEYN